MIIEWKILLLTLPLACCLLAICYVTGLLLSRVVSISRKLEPVSPGSASIFWKLIGGLIFIIGIYAAVVTNFRSSLLPIPFLACALLRLESSVLNLHPANLNPTTNRSTWIFLFIAIFFYWIFYALHFAIPANDSIPYNSGDTLFYARAADFLNHSAVEGVNIDYSNLAQPIPEPYHYGDLWTIALVQKLTGLPSALIVSTVVYPVIAAIFFLGLGNYLWSGDMDKSPQKVLLLLLCGFISGFYFLYPSFLFPGSFNLGRSLVLTPKLFFAGIFFVAIFLLHKKESWNGMAIIASAGSLLFINIAPALLIILAGLGIYWISKKRKNLQLFANPIYFILSVSALVYFFLFYKVNSPNGFNPGGMEFSLKRFFTILSGGLLQLLPISPFFLLFFVTAKPGNDHSHSWKRNKDLVLMAMVLLAGILSWSIFYASTPEAVQFFSNVLIPVSCIIVASSIYRALASKQKNIIVITIVLFGLSILLHIRFLRGHTSVSKKDVSTVSKFLEDHQPGKFANLQSAKEFTNYFVRNTMVIQPLSFISYLYPGYFNVSLNTPSIYIDSSWSYARYEENVLAAAPFNQFIEKTDTTLSIEESAYLFITQNRFRYLAISPDTSLPERLLPLVKDSITLSDNWHIYYIEK